MKHPLPTRRLPERPDLGQLKRQAKELLEAFLVGEESAIAEVNRFYHDADGAKFALHDAQLVLARSYGFGSWPKIKAYVDGITVERLTQAVRANDVEQVPPRVESKYLPPVLQDDSGAVWAAERATTIRNDDSARDRDDGRSRHL